MYAAVLGALLIGLSLGLLGAGGSILTVPVLVYVLGHEGKAAIAESLAIVGSIALLATLPYARQGLVVWRNVVFFGLPGMAGSYGGAWLSQFLRSGVQLTLFALVMLAAAWTMFRPPGRPHDAAFSSRPAAPHAAWKIVLQGLAVGLLTGLLGVGGGFLVVPALVVLGGLPMRAAVATSLPIIALNALTGLLKYLAVLPSAKAAVGWSTVALFVLVGAAGTLAGNLLSARIDQTWLRRGFAMLLVGIGALVLIQEVPRVLRESPAAAVPPR